VLLNFQNKNLGSRAIFEQNLPRPTISPSHSSPLSPTTPSGQDLSSVIFLPRNALYTFSWLYLHMCLCNHAPLPCSVAHVFLLWNNLDWSFYCKKICGWLCWLVFFVGSVASSCGHRWWDYCGGNEQNWHFVSLQENSSSGEWHYKLLVHVTTNQTASYPTHNPPFRDLSRLPNHLDCQFATGDLHHHDVTSSNVLAR